jgi:hypothetical protein
MADFRLPYFHYIITWKGYGDMPYLSTNALYFSASAVPVVEETIFCVLND